MRSSQCTERLKRGNATSSMRREEIVCAVSCLMVVRTEPFEDRDIYLLTG